MSNFYNNLTEYINTHIKEYCKVISDKYNLNLDEVYSIWTENNSKPLTKPLSTKKPTSPVNKASVATAASASGTSVEDFDLTPNGINKATKPILVSICKSYNLPYSGTKDELKPRILEVLGLLKPSENKESKTEQVNKPLVKTPSKRSPVKKEELINKISNTAPTITITKNRYDNFEHPDSHLVFNPKTQEIIGKQQEDGTVSSLCAEDIEECKKYNFRYALPQNLNSGKKEDHPQSEDEQVEEIEEEEVEEEEEIEAEDD